MKVLDENDVITRSIHAGRKRGSRITALLRVALAVFLLFALMTMSSCGGDSGASASSGGGGGGSDDAAAAEEGGYEAPKFKNAVFDEESSEGIDSARVDLSHSDDGYFAIKVSSDSRIKLIVEKDGERYIYDVVLDKVQIFPFQLGSGSYKISIMQNIVDSKYSELYTTWAEVSLSDDFGPFLRPSQYADYSKDSECVKKAAELAGKAPDANGVVTNIYDYVCKTVTYDREKAATVQSGYLPVPDETMKTGKGICFDYASLAAAMLRSQGIPTKIIFGYVGEGEDLYHAWNMYYTKESGWVAVEFEVNADEWNRLDLTFSANGEDSQFIGDGSNYLDVYQF